LDPANSSHIIGSDHQGAVLGSVVAITRGITNNTATMGTKFNATSGTVIKLSVAQIAAISAALQP
jgi:hypothetical protein